MTALSEFTVLGPKLVNAGDVGFALAKGVGRWLFVVSFQALQDAAEKNGQSPIGQSLAFFRQFQDRIFAIALDHTRQPGSDLPILIDTTALNN